MDPNETLRMLRAWAARVLADATPDADGAVGFVCDSEVLAAERFDALDKWIENGGFLPRNWNGGTFSEARTDYRRSPIDYRRG